jgi:hypothetical protein
MSEQQAVGRAIRVMSHSSIIQQPITFQILNNEDKNIELNNDDKNIELNNDDKKDFDEKYESQFNEDNCKFNENDFEEVPMHSKLVNTYKRDFRHGNKNNRRILYKTYSKWANGGNHGILYKSFDGTKCVKLCKYEISPIISYNSYRWKKLAELNLAPKIYDHGKYIGNRSWCHNYYVVMEFLDGKPFKKSKDRNRFKKAKQLIMDSLQAKIIIDDSSSDKAFQEIFITNDGARWTDITLDNNDPTLISWVSTSTR